MAVVLTFDRERWDADSAAVQEALSRSSRALADMMSSGGLTTVPLDEQAMLLGASSAVDTYAQVWAQERRRQASWKEA